MRAVAITLHTPSHRPYSKEAGALLNESRLER